MSRFSIAVAMSFVGFGDAGRKTLYIAARTSIYKIR